MVSDLDIGHDIGVHLDLNKQYLFLKNTWEPSKNYIFPTKTENKHNRKFQIYWLSKYKWLAYSKLRDGGFCKYYVLFGSSYGGVGCQVRFT